MPNPDLDHLTLQFRLYDGDVPSEEFLWTTPKVALLQLLDVTFEAGWWHVTASLDDGPTWHGSSDNLHAAVLDWLADRMALKDAPAGPAHPKDPKDDSQSQETQ